MIKNSPQRDKYLAMQSNDPLLKSLNSYLLMTIYFGSISSKDKYCSISSHSLRIEAQEGSYTHTDQPLKIPYDQEGTRTLLYKTMAHSHKPKLNIT
jgi:hypothetical protein